MPNVNYDEAGLLYATKRNRDTKSTTETWIHLPKIKVNEIKIILTLSSVNQSTQMTPQYNSGRYSSHVQLSVD